MSYREFIQIIWILEKRGAKYHVTDNHTHAQGPMWKSIMLQP